MMKKNESKNDKIKVLLIFFIVYACLSWIIVGTTYQSGQLVEVDRWYRAGLFDLIAVIFAGITYKVEDIFYILFVGGMYGILSQAESYKRVVSNTADFVKHNSIIAFLMFTLIVSLYTAISSNIITLFVLVPFIMSVFLKAGHDKITALLASFGGLFVGYLGQIVGTYGNDFLFQYFEVTATTNVVIKLVIFVIAFVLFNVFGIYHLINNKETVEENADMYAIDEIKVITRKRDQIMTWPTVVVAIMVLIVIMMGYIPWKDAFGVTLFDKVHTAVMGLAIRDFKLVETIIGSRITALGTWTDFLPSMFMLTIYIFVVGFTNRLSFAAICEKFGIGVKKIAKVALVYGLAFSFLYMMTAYPWPTALVDLFINTKSYNIVFILLGLIASILAVIFCSDPLFSGYYYGQYLSAIFTVNMGITTILWRVGSALGLLVGPTSFLLLAALVYADIPYTKWLKYIWKFVLSFFIAVVLVLAIAIM